MVELSGGAESTTNRVEQTNLAESLWVMEGAYDGLKALYPDRFDDDGLPVQTCDDDGTTVYGAEACEDIIAAYTAGITDPAPCTGADECNANIQCYSGNDVAGTSQTTEDLCDLVSLKYGLSQW